MNGSRNVIMEVKKLHSFSLILDIEQVEVCLTRNVLSLNKNVFVIDIRAPFDKISNY
jgi:hypothetical protein